jgi:predicted ATPase/class 3 adenylate cyclase
VGTVTFLFTDIEGSTSLLQRVGEDVYAAVLAAHHEVIRASLAAHGGKEVDTQGDAFFAVFSSPRACVAAALEMQRALATRPWPGGEYVRVRMGVHSGDAAQTAAGFIGLDVHRAARVAAVGYGGQVLVSESAAVLLRDGLPADAGLIDLGVHQLKDLGRPERIFQLAGTGLPTEFPPLRSLGNPALQHNLPAQLTPFIGREAELSRVRGLVESSRLVTLTGAGGCGKTRLALQAAAELLDGSGDGVWLVELAAVTGETSVAQAVAEALRIPAQAGRPVVDLLGDAMERQNLLIVLDNCEHLIGACAKITDSLLRRCARVRVLATSREPLGIDGEVIYRVPSLSLPNETESEPGSPGSYDAVALFAARAAAQDVDLVLDEQTAPLAVSVCRRLDGMPLAIELAAARLRSMSLAELHDRLDQRFRLLTGGSRTALERQQTLRATVSWSYALLTGSEQALLRRLSVFADSFDLAAAEGVCGFGDIDSLDAADLLGSLVDKSLVIAEQGPQAGRYRLLETIRQFATEQLDDSTNGEAAAVAAAHGRYYLALAEAAEPRLTGQDQAATIARLDPDQANLRLAADRAAGDPARTTYVLRLGVALRRYWNARGPGEDYWRLLAALASPEARSDPALFAAGLTAAALHAMWVDLAVAAQVGEQAVEVARGIGDDRLLVDALVALASVPYYAGQPAHGLPFASEAAELARNLGDDVRLGRTLMVCLMCGGLDPAASEQVFKEALACTKRSGDELTKYLLCSDASCRALLAEDIPAARAYVEEAAQAEYRAGLTGASMQIQLAWVLRAEQNPTEAGLALQTALRGSVSCRNRHHIAYCFLGFALLAADTQDWELAAKLHGAAQVALERTGHPWQQLEDGYRQQGLEQVRAALSGQQFDRAYATGMALSPEAAVNLALGSPRWHDGGHG